MIPILSHSNANRSLVTSPPRTPTNQAIIPIGHRLAKNAPILDQSENSCVSKRGTSVLCGPDRSVSTEDDPTDKETKTTRQSNVNPMQIKCQSANLPIQCQSYNNPPINRQFDNTSPIHRSYSNLWAAWQSLTNPWTLQQSNATVDQSMTNPSPIHRFSKTPSPICQF